MSCLSRCAVRRYSAPSGKTDHFGSTVLSTNLQPYHRDIFVLLLTRLTGAKTEKFTQGFIRTIFLPIALRKPGLGASEVYQNIEALQAGFFSKMLEKILPDIQKTPAKDRKTIMVGLACLLTKCEAMLTAPGVAAW